MTIWFILFLITILLCIIFSICSAETDKSIYNFLLFITFIVFILLLIKVTTDDEKYIKKHQKLFTVEYTLISFKMDDDGEYHFIGSNSSGTTVGNDVDNYDIPIYYGNYTTPKIIEYFKDPYGDNQSYRYKAEIYLPNDYKIDIFKD